MFGGTPTSRRPGSCRSVSLNDEDTPAMSTALNGLPVGDADEEPLVRELRRAGHDVSCERAQTAAQMRAALGRGGWDLVLAYLDLPSFSSAAALELLKGEGLD